MAWLKDNNVAAYERFDRKLLRDEILAIRATRRKHWRQVVLPMYDMSDKLVPISQLSHVWKLFDFVFNEYGGLEDCGLAFDLLHWSTTLLSADR